MITGGTIIQGGTDTFTPVISRMLEIAGEFIPYIVYIFIGYLGVILLWNAVKYILGYLKGKSEGTFTEEDRNYQRYRHDKDDYKGKLKKDNYYLNLKYDPNDKGYKKRKKYFNK